MKRGAGPAWMAGGVVLGALVTAALLGALPVSILPVSVVQNLPEPLLARLLISREASNISRTKSDVGGVTLFSRAEYAGDTLCSVRTYSFITEVAEEDERWPSLQVSEAFGLWTEPNLPGNQTPDAGRTACAKYDDFDHLIRGRPEEIIPAVRVVDLARKAASLGSAEFSVSCLGQRQRGDRPRCDGIAYLGQLNLKKVEEARVLGEPLWGEEPGARRQFWIFVNDGSLHGHPRMTALTITTEEIGHRQDPRIISVTIDRQAY